MASRPTIIVTGGAGFIGSHTVDALLQKKYKVIVIDDLSSGHARNVSKDAVLVRGSITVPATLTRVFSKYRPQAVMHFAAQKNVRTSVADPLYDAEQNIIGSLHLLQAMVKHKTKRIIFASTGGAVYGDAGRLPTPETHATQPASPYGIAKLSVEYYLHYYAAMYGIGYAAMRYANVYGPRQDPHGEAGVVAIFCQKILQGEPAMINGSGKQTRDYVYVGDVVSANMAALEAKRNGIWNIGTGKETDVVTLYRLAAEEAESGIVPTFGPAKPGEQMRSCLSYAKAHRELGWRPEHTIREGMRLTLQSFYTKK
jgi:UDP-glucose 4-epimerase